MAARNYRNRVYSWHAFPVELDAQVSIGSTGAPTLVSSSTIPRSNPSQTQPKSQGIKSITRLSAGIYQIQLQDNFSALLDAKAIFTAPLSGSPLAVDASDAALSVGTVYQIVSVGTSTTADWQTLGLPTGLTPTAGMIFKAAATGAGTGNGTASVIGSNAASGIQLLGSSLDNMLNNQPFNAGSGGYIYIKCIGQTGTVSAPTFTGTALGTHTHDFIIIGGQAASTTNDVAIYAGPIIGKEAASNSTVLGANSATAGGVVAASAGTPAGTNSAPTFTGTSAATDPSASTTMYLRFLLSNSSVG